MAFYVASLNEWVLKGTVRLQCRYAGYITVLVFHQFLHPGWVKCIFPAAPGLWTASSFKMMSDVFAYYLQLKLNYCYYKENIKLERIPVPNSRHHYWYATLAEIQHYISKLHTHATSMSPFCLELRYCWWSQLFVPLNLLTILVSEFPLWLGPEIY